MKIVADENIPLIPEYFGSWGTIVRTPGREISSEIVRDAEVLLVRSVTPVNRALLENSPVEFVGSATIGLDHMDLDYLSARGIAFAHAPGSNADSVVEYLLAVITVLGNRHGFSIVEKSVGIVGQGHVGRGFRERLEKLGVSCRAYDPYLSDRGEVERIPLEEVLAADIVSLNPSLSRGGRYPSHHMIGAAELGKLKPGAILINTSRGAVVDSPALLKHLAASPLIAALDVWENEPRIDAELARRTALATPHIAGYSLEGKLKGVEMIYRAACRHFSRPVREMEEDAWPKTPAEELFFDEGADPEEVILAAVTSRYDPRRDDRELRASLDLPEPDRVLAFDRLRRDYPIRREFGHSRIRLGGNRPGLVRRLKGYGFEVRMEPSSGAGPSSPSARL